MPKHKNKKLLKLTIDMDHLVFEEGKRTFEFYTFE